MKIISATNFIEAYSLLLKELIYFPDFKPSPRGMVIHEIVPCHIAIGNPSSSCLVTGDVERDKVLSDYLAKESELFASGSDSAVKFSEASKFWLKIANPDGTVNSNYGKLLYNDKSCRNSLYTDSELTPFEWAYNALVEDKDTRQAIMPFMRPDHLWKGNKDVVCTAYGHFFIRDDTLSLQIRMRSQDVWLGMPYDLPWFMGLMEDMVDKLSSVYRLKLGTFHHTVDSLHLYGKDFAKATDLYNCHLIKNLSVSNSFTL